jgi:hypothetical protein
MDAETMTGLLNTDLMFHATSVAETLPTLRQLWTEAPPQQSKNGDDIYLHKKVYHAAYEVPPVPAGLGNGTQTQMPVRQRGGMVYDEANLRRERYVAHQTTSTKGDATPHYTRMYPSMPDRWDDDPLLRAVHRLFAEVFTEAAQLEMGIRQPAGNRMFQFCYRTELQAADGRIKGDPGPEGVHVDGGTAAMILVMRRDNIKPLTGGTRVWSPAQETGKPTQADIDSNKLLHTWEPTHPLEALFFLDESVLHDALQGELLDQGADALRDMLIVDIRRKDLSWQQALPQSYLAVNKIPRK